MTESPLPLPPLRVLTRTDCRVCHSPLEIVLDLGPLTLNAFPATLAERDRIPTVRVTLCVCTGCGLAQLDRTVAPDLLYRTYHYRSGINEAMVQELETIVRAAVNRVRIGTHSYVLDIGANDGTLLAQYATVCAHVPQRIAVEPARNLARDLGQHADWILNDYFPDTSLVRGFPGRFSIITAIAMCYDLEDPRAFFEAIHLLLHEDGLAIVQFQDLGQQIQAAAFDNCCHEHLEYYTLWSLMGITDQVGLQVVQVEQTPINGGSLRVYLRQARREPHQASVLAQLYQEADQGLSTAAMRAGDLAAFVRFAQRVARAQDQIQGVVAPIVAQGRTLDIYGASTKGNILLQVLGIGPSQARQAIDRSPHKTGLHTITGIPIVGERVGRQDPADVWLSPIWQFRESVLRREAWYLEQGGTIVFPLPATEVVQGLRP